MNFALIIDSIGTNDMDSFYVKQNQAYTFKDNNPYSPSHMLGSVGSKCFISTFNYPWLYENGHFLNWSEFKYDLPDLDLDSASCLGKSVKSVLRLIHSASTRKDGYNVRHCHL